MRKDINLPEVKDIGVAVVKEANDSDQAEWNVYIINFKNEKITSVFITSKGYGTINDEVVKTSDLRHFFEEIDSESFQKIEIIQEAVFGLNNEYWVSFYQNNEIYDKRYIFLPESIIEDNMVMIPIINKKGIIIK